MKKILPCFAFLCLVSHGALAQSNYWKDQNGKAVPETASMKSQNGFGGSILVTTDADWKKKWETPADVTPKFTVAQEGKAGQKLTLLTFFSNAELDAAGNANVRCDIALIDPKGVSSEIKKDGVCFDGPMKGSPRNVYLSRPTIDMVFNPTDARGTWTFEVKLRDEVRKAALTLRTSVELK